MVIINEEIENVLLDVYSMEFARNVHTPNYYALKANLFALDKRYVNRIPGRYPAWKRMGWFEFVYRQHIFGYSWDGENVVLQDYYSLKNENIIHQYSILESKNNKKMKNKQIIRLTESDLHNMISEAVKTALNELDPRTYASAAEKARERGDNRANKYRNAAVDAWNRDYGIDNLSKSGQSYHGRKMKFIPNPSTVYNYQPDQYGVDDWTLNHDNNSQSVVRFRPYGYGKTEFDGEYSGGGQGDLPYDDKYLHKKLGKEKPYRVAGEMTKGNGRYTNGKGWQ